MIKLAMIKIHAAFSKHNFRSKMLLQVHDELVFEVRDDEIERMKKLVKHEMEGVVKLAVPVRVDMGVGKNWDEAH